MILNEKANKDFREYRLKVISAIDTINDNYKKINDRLSSFKDIAETIDAYKLLYERCGFDGIYSRYYPHTNGIYYDLYFYHNNKDFMLMEKGERVFTLKLDGYEMINDTVDDMDCISRKNILLLAERTTKFVELMDGYIQSAQEYFRTHDN